MKIAGQSTNLMRAVQVAERLAIPEGAVWDLVRRRRLASVRLGERRIRFRPEDVEALIEQAVAA